MIVEKTNKMKASKIKHLNFSEIATASNLASGDPLRIGADWAWDGRDEKALQKHVEEIAQQAGRDGGSFADKQWRKNLRSRIRKNTRIERQAPKK